MAKKRIKNMSRRQQKAVFANMHSDRTKSAIRNKSQRKNRKRLPYQYLKEGDFYHGIYNTKESHWGIGQTGVGLSKNGKYAIATNRPSFKCKPNYIQGKGGKYYPTHSTLAGYSAIYSYGYKSDENHGTIWLYPDTEKNIDKLKPSLKNLIGHHGITRETVVKSNTSRKELFKLGDLEDKNLEKKIEEKYGKGK